MNALSSTLLAWLLTYLIHSTVLLGVAWLVTRRLRLDPAASDVLWKVALLAPLITGTIQSRLELATPQAVRLPATQPATPDPGRQADVTDPGRQPGVEAAPGTPDTPGLRPGSGNPTPSRAPSLPLVVVLLWGVIALASSLYYVARRLILIGRLADRRAVGDGPLAATLADLQRTTGYRRRVRLTMARTISSPVALGLSEICVPELALSELGVEQQRSMLAHELAHLARRDSVWLAGASLMERLFFFQPFNRLARRELETAAEYLSDEWAMQKTGSAVSLAKCLATVAEWIQASPLGVPVAGLAERRSLLVSRISRLLDGRLASSPASRRVWAAAAALGVVVTIAAAPRVASPLVPAGETSTVDTTRSIPEVSAPVVSRKLAAAAPVPDQDTTVVNALIARLKDENAGVRRAAARSLGNLGDLRAVQPLIAVLADSNAEVRSAAIEALADLEDPRAIGPIAGLLKDPVADVKHNALNALSNWEQGVPTAPVVALLEDPDADVRREAVNLLDHLHARSAGSAIARLIRDPSPDVRHAVVQALGNLGEQSGAAAITEALADANADVRQAALGALDDLKAPIAEATLLNLMNDANADVRQRAAQLAGERSVIAAIPALRRLIDDPRGDVREAATEALGHIADPAARQALRAALQSPDPKVRRAAAEALGQDP
ncbi:MAG TPA: HEAT repeat domain-containing protein [Gemmatimonadales bacterium]|jgi:HEAT repeat protein/beta-lactamase regulating signal transducer with metallopeptidase domain|nr:HEAT repeat domain-containing protein [Gemmatimonadales bacterium]